MGVKNTAATAVAETPESTETQGVQSVEQVVPAQMVSAPVFRDKRYTSRTLILPDGLTAQVTKAQIAADTAELLAYLESHEDFTRILE